MIQPAGSLWGSNLAAASGRAVNARLEPGRGALCIGCADAQAQGGNGGKDHGFHVHVDLLIWSAMPCGEAELFCVSMGEDQTTTPFIPGCVRRLGTRSARLRWAGFNEG